MKVGKSIFVLMMMLAAAVIVTGCCRSKDDVWDDTKTCSRHVSRGFKTLGGKHGDSRQVRCREEFMANCEEPEQDFVTFPDQKFDDQIAMADTITRQPKESPGDPGSSIPSVDSFQDPSMIPGLAAIFRNISFDYNSNLVKGQDNLDTIYNISNYMKSHPNTYVFVCGHCDERGPEAYNLALGARRSNAVRNLLISEGVNPDNVFSVSYGKERPLVMEHHEEAWAKNRRADFKIYQR